MGEDKRQLITEEMKVHEEWYEEAKKVTLEELPSFINHLVNDYGHDYGTICHALTAGAIATMYAMDKSDCGGITGFQASCIMWLFIRHWCKTNNKCGMKLIDYDNFLYPQNGEYFDKVINADVFKKLQECAKENLNNVGSTCVHDKVSAHWRSIVDGVVPFGYRVNNDD